MNSKYDEMYMSEEDLIQSRGIDASIANGVMSVEEGHGLKEAIRKKYGYSGGADGSEYIKLETKQSGFDAGKLLSALAGSGNKWDAPLEKAAREYTGMSYDDFTKGDDYASLAKRYSENGQKAMNKMLAEIAARTGGMASSYATTAAGQTYNDYMTRLEDAARAMYEGERADAAEDLSVLRTMRDTEDSRKKDLYAIAYESMQDQKADARYEREYADSRADEDREWEYKVGQDAKADEETAKAEAREQVQMFFSNGGALADLPVSLRDAAGYTNEELSAMASRAQTLLGREAEEYKGSMAKFYDALDGDGGGEDDELTDLYTALAKAGATDYESARAILLANKYGEKASENIAAYFADTYLPSVMENNGTVTRPSPRLGYYKSLASNSLKDPRRGNDAAYYALEEAVKSGDITIEEANQIAEDLGINAPEV